MFLRLTSHPPERGILKDGLYATELAERKEVMAWLTFAEIDGANRNTA